MGTKKATEIVGRVNTWAAFAERLWGVTRYFGFDGWIAAAFWAASGAAWAIARHVMNVIPWHVSVILGLVFATALLHFWNKLRVAWALRGLKTIDIVEFGQECCDYYREYAEFMLTRQDAKPVSNFPREDGDAHRAWQAQVNFSQRNDALVLAKFGPRAYSIALRMQTLGIKPPSLVHFPSASHDGVGVHIGAIGDLLKKGQLDEARKFDPNSTWGVGFR